MEDTRLPKCVMFGEMVGARAVWGARKKSGWGVSWTTSELSASTPTGGRLQLRAKGNGAERQNKGGNIEWQNGSLQKIRHAVVCPNVTVRTKERIAQSKRARAGSLAVVDQPQVARTCDLRVFGLQISFSSFSGVTFVLFCIIFVFMLSLKPRPLVQRSFDMQAPR